MEKNVRGEMVKQLRDVREVMLVHSKAHRGHKAAIQRLIAKFDKAQKAVDAIRTETNAANLANWVMKFKASNIGLHGKGLEISN
jgi:hypothetical protein